HHGTTPLYHIHRGLRSEPSSGLEADLSQCRLGRRHFMAPPEIASRRSEVVRGRPGGATENGGGLRRAWSRSRRPSAQTHVHHDKVRDERFFLSSISPGHFRRIYP